MARSRGLLILACAAALTAWTAAADDGDRKLRLIGRADAAEAPTPKAFVIDAVISRGDGPLQSRVEGWFAALPPDAASGEIDGQCVEDRCVLSVDIENGKLTLTGDLAKPGASSFQGRVLRSEGYDDTPAGEAAVAYTPVGEDIPGVGRLALENAITALDLAALAVWTGASYGFSNRSDGPVEDMERQALAQWQAAKELPGHGLILVDQLETLKADVAAARAKARWTPVQGKGWAAGYPAALLTPAGPGRYATADGSGSLVIAVDPPMGEEVWDTLVDSRTADTPGRETEGYTRVNDDMQIVAVAGETRSFELYRRRPGGVARLVLTYPKDRPDGLDAFEEILAREFRVTDELAP